MDIRWTLELTGQPRQNLPDRDKARTLGFAAGFLGRGGCLPRPFAVPRVPAFPQIPVFLRSDSAVRSFIVRLHRIAPSLICPGKSASKNLLVMSQLIEKPEARRPSGLDKVHGKLVSSVQESDRNIM